jgi:hypothetical protein
VTGRIIFVCPFPKAEISGGIKTAYRQAELLVELGFDCSVYQPDGRPTWFESRARLIPRMIELEADDVLVFPESLNGPIAELATRPTRAKKILFCQAHTYALTQPVPPERNGQLGFHRVAAPSAIAKGFLERMLHFKDVAVIPCFVDHALFVPKPKTAEIAFLPQKRPREAAILHSLFHLKYPELKSVPWRPIEKTSERAVADIFGRAGVVLSLPSIESFGLVPLEAMAAGAIVVGFDGYGGREYATPENGFWFPPDHIEETADALARTVKGLTSGAPELDLMRRAGAETAARYTKDRTRAALRDFYGSLV